MELADGNFQEIITDTISFKNYHQTLSYRLDDLYIIITEEEWMRWFKIHQGQKKLFLKIFCC